MTLRALLPKFWGYFQKVIFNQSGAWTGIVSGLLMSLLAAKPAEHELHKQT